MSYRKTETVEIFVHFHSISRSGLRVSMTHGCRNISVWMQEVRPLKCMGVSLSLCQSERTRHMPTHVRPVTNQLLSNQGHAQTSKEQSFILARYEQCTHNSCMDPNTQLITDTDTHTATVVSIERIRCSVWWLFPFEMQIRCAAVEHH